MIKSLMTFFGQSEKNMCSMMAHLIYHVIVFRYWKNCQVEEGFHILCPSPEEELELINESYGEADYCSGSKKGKKNSMKCLIH